MVRSESSGPQAVHRIGMHLFLQRCKWSSPQIAERATKQSTKNPQIKEIIYGSLFERRATGSAWRR